MSRRPPREQFVSGNPYTLRGKCVYKKITGKKVGCSKDEETALRYFRKLEMIAHKND